MDAVPALHEPRGPASAGERSPPAPAPGFASAGHASAGPASAGPASAGPGSAVRMRAAVEYAIRGDLRYLSHHNEIRMLARALVRAGWPLRFSEGYNPIPRFSIVLPRSVALASEQQVAIVELSAPWDDAALSAALRPQMPAEAPLLVVRAPFPPRTPEVAQVLYRLAVRPEHAAGLAERVQERLAAREWVVPRRATPGKPAQDVDIRPFVEDVNWDGAELCLCLRHLPRGTARPLELVLGLGLPAEVYGHRVCRAAMIWKSATTPAGGGDDVEGNKSESSIGNDHQHESQDSTQNSEEEDRPFLSGGPC